jgi:hypothetical protein
MIWSASSSFQNALLMDIGGNYCPETTVPQKPDET